MVHSKEPIGNAERQETWVRSLGQEDLLEEEMSIHSSIPAGIIPWTEETCRLSSMDCTKDLDMTEWLHVQACTHKQINRKFQMNRGHQQQWVLLAPGQQKALLFELTAWPLKDREKDETETYSQVGWNLYLPLMHWFTQSTQGNLPVKLSLHCTMTCKAKMWTFMELYHIHHDHITYILIKEPYHHLSGPPDHIICQLDD